VKIRIDLSNVRVMDADRPGATADLERLRRLVQDCVGEMLMQPLAPGVYLKSYTLEVSIAGPAPTNLPVFIENVEWAEIPEDDGA
jgi:hypothetical protein